MGILSFGSAPSDARSGKIVPALLCGVVWVVAGLLLVGGLMGSRGLDLVSWLDQWGTTASAWCAVGVGIWRTLAFRQHAKRWACLTLACLLWAGADSFYSAVLPNPISVPGPADIGYTLFPIVMGIAVIVYARERGVRLSGDAALDAGLALLSTAALLCSLMFSWSHPHVGTWSVMMTTFLYPVLDVALISVVSAVGSLVAWRFSRGFLGVALGILAVTAGDVVSYVSVASGNGTQGAWTALCWTVGLGCIALGALFPSEPPRSNKRHGSLTPLSIEVPIGFGMIALAILALSRPVGLAPSGIVFAVLTLLLTFVRLYGAWKSTLDLAESKRLANTDPLTGLPNRRRLLADLDKAFQSGRQVTLTIFDLDGFKLYNDTFGHVAGDQLLSSIAYGLETLEEPSATAYRLGGDEFCLIAAGGSEGTRAIKAAHAALQANGSGWKVTASAGSVALPLEAHDSTAALQLADRRMYARKARRPEAARSQASEVLLSAMGQQQPELEEHVHNATALAGAVAQGLGLSEDEVDDVVRATELHDVGKLAMPREILDKPGPLSAEEQAVMRRHTIVGDQMLRSAPALASIAPLVRGSHERWDGDGYPDGLAGEQIPIGARIVAVCDSFEAMMADRPYKRGRPLDDVVQELIDSSGSHFDPRVVECFLRVIGRSPNGVSPVQETATDVERLT